MVNLHPPLSSKLPTPLKIITYFYYVVAAACFILSILFFSGIAQSIFGLKDLVASPAARRFADIVLGVRYIVFTALAFAIAWGLWRLKKWAYYLAVLSGVGGLLNGFISFMHPSVLAGVDIIISGIILYFLFFSAEVVSAFGFRESKTAPQPLPLLGKIVAIASLILAIISVIVLVVFLSGSAAIQTFFQTFVPSFDAEMVGAMPPEMVQFYLIISAACALLSGLGGIFLLQIKKWGRILAILGGLCGIFGSILWVMFGPVLPAFFFIMNAFISGTLLFSKKIKAAMT